MKAGEVKIGDAIGVAGAYLHDDLAGLTVTLEVENLERSEGKTRIYDKYSKSWAWFWDYEEVVNQSWMVSAPQPGAIDCIPAQELSDGST